MKKLVVGVALAFLSGGLFAVDQTDYTQWVTLTNSDSASNPRVNSFAYHSSNLTNYWSDGCYPSKGKSYYVPAGRVLMTTTSSKNEAKFAGGRLHVAGGVYQRGSAYSGLSLGSDGVLLSGGYIRFAATNSFLYGAVGILATEDNPAQLQLNPSVKEGTDGKTDRGLLSIRGTITGEPGTAFKLVRTSANYYLTAPDSTYLAEESSFAGYFGTLILSNHVELAFLPSVADPSVPGTLRIENKSRLFSDGEGQAITVGTLEIASGAMMKWSFAKSGAAQPVIVTNALSFVDGAKAKVQFGDWYPKTGAQKYPIMRLTGPAAESAVTAGDFTLDVAPNWMGLPKTNNPRIAIDETADGKVISVEWPDEPEPFFRAGENGEVVFYGTGLYGNYVDGLADGDAPVSVVKEDSGTGRLGPTCSFTGSIDVREGKLIVGNPCWEYYRWVLQQTFNTTPYAETHNTSTRTVGIRSIGLFDGQGNDLVYGFTDLGDWQVANHYYRSYAYSKAIQPGHVRFTDYDGAQKICRGLSEKDSTESAVTNLFLHQEYSPTLNAETVQKHPIYELTNTWIVLTMRMTSDVPATTWDYVNYYPSTANQLISNCTLEASMDCKNWTQLGSVTNSKKPTQNTWQGDGSVFIPGFTTHTGGMPIDPWPMDPISFAASTVSVAAGATLEAHTGTAPVISDLLIDYEKGLGTIKGFAFAATGTLRITNTYGRSALHFAADLSGVQGLDNLKNWTIVIDGKDRTARRVLTVTAEGIRIEPKGFLLLISGAGGSGGGAPTYLTEPGKGATVPLLTARQKAFLRMTPGEVCTAISNEVDGLVTEDQMLKKIRSTPEPVTFRWRSGLGKVTVTVAKKGAETTPFFRSVVTAAGVSVSNLEVGTRYVVTLDGEAEHETREFVTEDLAPRCIGLSGRTNTRDMGGRTLPNGRRVRQGLLYRTGQFDNAGELSIGEETRRYIVETLGVKTDIDLRQDEVVQPLVDAGRVSPLGPMVEWIHEWDNYHDYASVHTTGADATARIFRYMMDPEKYPMVFHCAGGADRTGTLASLVHGVLGASDEQIWMDYLITSWAGAINQKRYPAWFRSFVRSFDGFEGATLSERICNYFKLTLGFTEDDLDKIRDILLEPAA